MTTFAAYNGTGVSALTSALVADPGIAVSNIVLAASSLDAVNFYDGSLTALGIGAGLLITSGTTPGTFNTVDWFGTDNSTGPAGFDNGDADIDAVVNGVFQTLSYDATALSFDFTVADPTATSISFDLVFGSDEFPEWVDQFVDCSIVMVNGVNHALFNHDPLHPLSVVSANLAAGYFQDNATSALPIEYDGVSHALKIVAPINPGIANHIKIGIADTGDHIYDSGIFIANLAAGHIPGSGVVSSTTPCDDSSNGVVGSAKDEYFDLKGGDDVAYAGAGDDIVVAGSGNDTVYGGSGNDQIKGDSGNDSLDGGDGMNDTAVFSGAWALGAGNYVFAAAGGSFTITDSTGVEGTDTLSNIEFARFSDGIFALAANGLTPVVGPAPSPANTPGIVFLSGIGAVGQTLTAQVSDADGVPSGGVTYVWQAGGATLETGTGTLMVGAGQAGQNITVSASYTDLAGNAESWTSTPKAIALPGDGDFAITLLNLRTPTGSSVMNPLTTLLRNAMDLGVSPIETGIIVKEMLGLDGIAANIDLRHYDAYKILLAHPDDATALLIEKKAVQIAVMASLGGDEAGMALTQGILLAHSNNTALNLADKGVIANLLGLDPLSPLVREIFDRNANIGEAVGLAQINSEWLDLQSGLQITLSDSIETLNLHVNQAPTGSATANLGDAIEGTNYLLGAGELLQGFSDADGDTLGISALSADHASVIENPGGTFTLTPFAGFKGPVELSYAVIDGQGGSAPANQLFLVAANQATPVNAAPSGTASAILPAGSEDTLWTVSAVQLLAGFSDADGDPLSISGLSADYGAVTDNGDGTFTVTPIADYNGPVTLSYNVTDGLDSIAATQSYSLAPINDAPTVGAYSNKSAVPGHVVSLSLGSLFSDVDVNDTLSFSAQGLPASLGIDTVTGLISGTAPATAGVHHIMVRATDSHADSVNLGFDLVISGHTISASLVTRSGLALPGVTAHEVVGLKPADSLFGFSNISVDIAVGTGVPILSADVLATGSSATGSLELTLGAISGATFHGFELNGPVVSAANAWSISANTLVNNGYGLTAFHGSDGIVADTRIGTLTLALPQTASGIDILALTGSVLGGHASTDRGLAYSRVNIGPTGQLSDTLPDGDLGISFARDTADYLSKSGTKPVTAADALDALKLSVGLSAASGSGWTELIAADMNHDGRVTAADALEILKASVGINTIPPFWVFVPDDPGINPNLGTMTKTTVTYRDDIHLSATAAPSSATITGILVGDVNNSWLIPT